MRNEPGRKAYYLCDQDCSI